ncbi:hypothetical protein GGR55DRAFT_696737 [Xylaria sp. FL0064]|nr:hypothetical protein GGR55DRAFT_696737 [Xylaria sp. FL0064]
MPDASLDPMENTGPITVLHARADAHGGRTQFSRLDSLKRHIKRHTEEPQHPCLLCDDHQGPRAFYRRDHLTQHERHVHRGNESPGALEAQEQTAVPAVEARSPVSGLLEVPNVQPPQFPCPVPGCGKCGDSGYLRQIDLNEHLQYFHGMLPQLGFAHPELGLMTSLAMNQDASYVPSTSHIHGSQQAFQGNAYLQLDQTGTYNEGNSEMIDVARQGFQIDGNLDLGFNFNLNFDGMNFSNFN